MSEFEQDSVCDDQNLKETISILKSEYFSPREARNAQAIKLDRLGRKVLGLVDEMREMRECQRLLEWKDVADMTQEIGSLDSAVWCLENLLASMARSMGPEC